MPNVPTGLLSEQYILNACYDTANGRLAAQPSTHDDTSSATSKRSLNEFTVQEILNLVFVPDDPTYGDYLRLY